MLVASRATVPLEGEWLEAFWCSECQQTRWYHVRKTSDRTYEVSLAPAELWQQATGVIHPQGNPSVGEFTRKHARMLNYNGIAQFKYIG
ncbi:hypothetical protein [Leptolyngbya sp. NK1-12]|nr:hypothetical protein [Leptolyngbya sp. NK1-12]